MSKDGDITLKQLAYDRIEEFTKDHTRYEEAMKLFNKMVSSDSKPGGEKQGLYPMGLIKVSQEIHDGTLAYCKAAKLLASDYAKFSKDPTFCKRYNERIEYIDIIKEDLAAAMQTLHEKLANVPIYAQNLVDGDAVIKNLNTRLDATKQFMQASVQKEQTYQKEIVTKPTGDVSNIVAQEPGTPKRKRPQH